MAYLANRAIFPTLHPHAMFFSPLGGEFAGESFVEDGGFTGFKAVQGILGLLLGLVQLGKQAFNAVNNALLFRKRWQWNYVAFAFIIVYVSTVVPDAI